MKMKHACMMGAGLLTLTVGAMAMGPGGGCGRGGEFQGRGMAMMAQMEQALDLTDAQKAQMADLRAQYADNRQRPDFAGKGVIAGMDPADPDYQANLDAMAQQAAELASQRVYQRAEMHTKMREILTPEQMEKWLELRATLGGGRGQGRGWRAQ